MKQDKNFFIRLIITTFENSFQITLSLGLTALGIRGFLTGFEYPTAFSRGFPTGFLVTYLSLAVIGGVCSLIGVYLNFRSFWFSGLERLGLYISAPAWGSYAIVNYVSPLSEPSFLEFFLYFGISIACLLRADFVNKKSEQLMNFLRVSAARHLKSDDV